MPARISPQWRCGSPRARLLAITLAIGVLLAGCGGSSPRLVTATAGGAGTAAPSNVPGGNATNSRSASPRAYGSGLLAFSKCMRANGVPNFPDPAAGGGGFPVDAGLNRSSPAFHAAQAKCRALLPGGGLPGPGTQTHPASYTLAKLLNIARCMRLHGVTEFPDPRTSVPANFSLLGNGNYTGLTDFDGAILAWPSTINFHAPAYIHAAAACGPLAQKIGLGHPH